MITESCAICLPKYDILSATNAAILIQMHIIVGGQGFTPDSAGEAYNASQDRVISCGGARPLFCYSHLVFTQQLSVIFVLNYILM